MLFIIQQFKQKKKLDEKKFSIFPISSNGAITNYKGFIIRFIFIVSLVATTIVAT